ncbi:N-6 DNA methylase [Actinopolyspora halophila]|uniref:N-6 DNA methylase n=1 Tax=Actinopolyspora halophila TaxID=1850 RepID=UPI00047638E6|nr:N-6 DNA methylase [Actinopolyspora halophila]
MPRSAAQVTAAEISRMAGVTRATVSNWRRRHPDFPDPVGGTETSPAYDAERVREWLAERGQLPQRTSYEELRAAVRVADEDERELVVRLLPLVSALAGLDEAELAGIARSAEHERVEALSRSLGRWLAEVPGVEPQSVADYPAAVLGPLLESAATDGLAVVVEVLTEVLAEDPSTGTAATPPQLAELMVRLLAESREVAPTRVFDPACGYGGLLLAAARAGAGELFGQDVVDSQVGVTSVRLGTEAPGVDSVVRPGDSFRSDAFPALRAEGVVCSPPYGIRDWGHEEVAYDPRWVFGVPPKSESELAWVQHCLTHLEPGGRAVLLLPPGVAERASGRRIRSELVRSGALRAVVALPAGAASPPHLGLHLWVLAAPDPDRREIAPVLFVHTPADAAVRGDSAGRVQSGGGREALDWSALRERVLASWRDFAADPEGFESAPGVACGRSAVDLLDENVDLTPQRHVHTTAGAVDPARQEELVRRLREELGQAGRQLLDSAGGPEWPPAGDEPVSWRTATVADLLRGGAVWLHRVSSSRTGDSEEVELPEECRVLSSRDVWEHREVSGSAGDTVVSESVEIAAGDVIMPDVLKGLRTVPVRVAAGDDVGALLGRHLHLLRPDPERLDSWFLAGFLGAEDNVHSATTGSSIMRLSAKRLRVPLVPPEQQRRYGRAFRQLHVMRAAARSAGWAAEETAREMAAGLTSGALLPPGRETGAE